MPRQSTAALSTLSPALPAATPRLTPPPTLSARERAVFQELVNSTGPDHFTRADLPLLVEYCTACVLARDAASALQREGAVHPISCRANPWLVVQEKQLRAMSALSLRLRICPQGRMTAARAGTHAKRPGARGVHALMELDDE